MNGYIVTLCEVPESLKAAYECKLSAEKFGVQANIFYATDRTKSLEKLEYLGIKIRDYDTSFSDMAAAVGNFISQYKIWGLIASASKPGIILEHDAKFIDYIPRDLEFEGILSIGIPSFGKFLTKRKPGVYKAFSKPGGYLPGAHAYIVKPHAAKRLIDVAHTKGFLPCDIFLNKEDFPDLEELSPGIVKAEDNFTTIQKTKGCLAKHGYHDGYKILTNCG